MMKCYVALSLVLLWGQVAMAKVQTVLPQLDARSVIERDLQGDNKHAYLLTLATGECARVELQAAQANLNLSVLSANNELIATITDTDAPGLKRLDIVAERATTYIIRVASEYDQARAAKYQLTLLEQRAATPSDRERFALHILAWEVVSLYYQREKTAMQQAVAKAREAAARWHALGDRQQEGRMLLRAGQALYVLSEYRAALLPFSQAAQAFHDAADRAAEGRCLFEMAEAHGTLVELSRAEEYHFKGVQLWREIKEPELPLLSAYNIGRVFRLTGDWQKARETLQQLLVAARAHPYPAQRKYYEQQALSELGYTEVGARQPQKALDYFAQALPGIQADLEHPYDTPFVLNQMAQAWLQLRETAPALDTCQQALQIARRLGQRRAEAVTLTTLGQVYDLLGRRAEAQTALKQAQALNAALGIKRDQPATALRLAQIAREQGNVTEALKQVEQALARIEELRAGLPPGNEARATFMANWKDAQDLQLDLLMQLHAQQPNADYAARAFDAAEYTRARLLLELIVTAKAELGQNLDPQLLIRARELREQITSRRSARDQAELIAEYNFVNGQIRQSNPRFATLIQTPPIRLSEVQTKLLDENTLLLEYALGEQRSFLFVVTPEALHTFILPGRKVIEPVARQMYEALSRSQQPKFFTHVTQKQAWLQRNERNYEQAAAKLSALILPPAAALLGNKRLLIVTDGALQYVPFAALPEPVVGGQWSVVGEKTVVGGRPSVVGKKQNQPLPFPKHHSPSTSHQPPTTNHQPLILNHEIISLPSASTLAVLRREWENRKTAPKTLAIFADPVFDAQDERVLAPPVKTFTFTPAPLPVLTEMDEAGNFSLPRLRASRVEAEEILKLVPPTDRHAAFDFDANYQAAIQSDLSQYRFVHFATHGLLNEMHPELSGLLLALVNRQGDSVAGSFTTLDAFNLKLNADLVVLSGCQTALGKEIKGEGLMGLTRGFMYAGARRVAASLWQVNDKATTELMQRFYQGMLGKKKLLPSAALRAAQREMRKDPRWHAPYYWAAFTLQGEW